MFVKKINEEFFVKVDTNASILGKPETFKCIYINDSTGKVTYVTSPFVEIIEPLTTPNSAIVLEDAPQGTSIIKTRDSTFQLYDIFAFGSDLYYISNIDVNGSLILRTRLKTSILHDTELTQVNSLGVYKVPITISTLGDYTIVIKSAYQNLSINIRVVREPIEEQVQYLKDNRKFRGFV